MYPELQAEWDEGGRLALWGHADGARPVTASVPDGAPASLLRTAADPLCWHGKTRARNAAEYLRATERCVAEMDTFTFPYLNFHRHAAF